MTDERQHPEWQSFYDEWFRIYFNGAATGADTDCNQWLHTNSVGHELIIRMLTDESQRIFEKVIDGQALNATDIMELGEIGFLAKRIRTAFVSDMKDTAGYAADSQVLSLLESEQVDDPSETP